MKIKSNTTTRATNTRAATVRRLT